MFFVLSKKNNYFLKIKAISETFSSSIIIEPFSILILSILLNKYSLSFSVKKDD